MTSEHEIFLHDRILDKLFLWMIPQWISPNSITIVRIILTPFVVFLNYHQMFSWGIPLFLFAAFTDAVDGSLARTRGQITNFGKLFDPLADKLLVGSMVVVLVFKYLNPLIGYIVIISEIIFIVFGVVQRIRGKILQANNWGKTKMVLQVIAVSLVLFGLTLGNQLWLITAGWVFGASFMFALVSLFFHGI